MNFSLFWVPWPRWAKRIWAVTIILGLLGAANMLFLFLSAKTTEIPSDGGVYYEAVLSRVQTVNPYYCNMSTLDRDLCELIFSGLTKYDPVSKEIRGDAAYKWDISSDGKEYTFYLRQGMKWHDGTPLTSADVIFSYKDILQSSDYLGSYQMTFYNVNIEALDDYTVKFTLQEPQAFFLYSVTLGLLPRHILQSIPVSALEQSTFNKNPIGSGPFKFTDLETERDFDIVTLTASDLHYESLPHIRSIVIYGFASMNDLLNKQEIFDGIKDIPNPEYIHDNFESYTVQLPRVTGIFFNLKHPVLTNFYVREAMKLAVDKQVVLGDLHNISIINSPLPYLDHDTSYTPEVELAKEKLFEADWKIYSEEYDDGIRRNKNMDKLSFIMATTKSDENVLVARKLKEAWQQVGIEVEVVSLEIGDLQESLIKPRKYDILLIGEEMQANMDLYPYLHSSQIDWPGLNLSQYKNVETDLLLDKIRATNTYADQLQMTYTLLDTINASLPVLYMYSPEVTYFVKKDMENILIPPRVGSMSDRFYLFNEWAKKRKRVWN